ncbi:MAG: peptidylprolyl isomerase [Odoribacter sp.]|nr:peptidylprolyl isomerase [Odoribacter sp.]
MLGSCAKSSIKNSKLVTENDTLSYAIGANFYTQLERDSIFLNPLILAKSLMDAKEGKLLMTEAEYQNFLMRFSAKMQEAQMKKQAEANKVTYTESIAENEAFLLKNSENPGVTVTASGLQYEVIKMGTGPKPAETSTVKVHYTGTLIDGTKFDSSYDRNEPSEFPVNGVIKGWTEALQLMPVGSKFKLYLPESIAYGANGAGNIIKPYSALIFEVELLEIVK